MSLSEGEPRCSIAPKHHSEVKVGEEFIETVVPGSSVRLLEDSMNAIAALWKAMYPACSIHNSDFRMLLEEQSFEDGEALAAAMDFVLPDLQYNIRRVRDEENSYQDIFGSVGSKSMSNLCSEMLQPGAQAHIFCAMLQF